ncbi:tetratricopeptide repeat protein 37 [Vespa crabro]|uniref:tetratricopeptide repeat protein 37 n=1 Tax=Vespa crabro TaxID=7445 RepID=UPI001EFF7F69|nr:tetratricopeptide repeat protein 37 [Vespa crabro]
MSAENKAVLQEVKNLYKQNEYSEAIKKCKKILKKDKNNYLALILLGASMLEVEECKSYTPAAFQKAIDIQPNNPLAWQGLVTYYEKESKNNCNVLNQLIESYCKLLELDSDMSNALSVLEKIANLLLFKKDSLNLNQGIETLNCLRKKVNEEKQSLINKTLAYVLTEQYDNILQFKDILENVLANVIKDTNVVNRQDYYRKYLKLLYTSNKIITLLHEATQMHEEFVQDICPLEWICKVYYEENIYNKRNVDIDIVPFYESLRKLDNESEAGILAEAIHLDSCDNLIKSREILNQLVLIKPQSFHGYVMLSKINKKLYCWEDVESASTEALNLITRRSIMWCSIQVLLIESLSRSNDIEKWKLAEKLCKEMLAEKSSEQLHLFLARINVLLDNDNILDELSNLESKSDTRVEAVILRALFLKNHKNLEEAADVLGSALETSESWSLLGKIYWEMADYNHSLMAFLNSVQADRYNWESLVYLGHYYHEHCKDIERSRKCYQTALQINPNSEQAGIGLSTTLRLLKNSEANIQLLRKLTAYSSGPKWAWLQLGLYYLDRGEATEAIKALQHVIRADPGDNHGWESLADAYWSRGAYKSALKSYQRALDLCPGSLYSMIQVANIKLIIGEFEEAKEDFKKILSNESHYIPALKGLAETCLSLATKNISHQFLGRARDNLQQAIECLTDAVLNNSKLSCIWKLLGDVCYRSAVMSEKYSYLQVMPFLINRKSTEKYIIIKRVDLFLLSTRSYCRALSLSKDSALLWHDLACCYYAQLLLNPSIDRKDIAIKSLSAAKYAVKLCPTSWLHWNILAIICMASEIKNYALAQHSYVMSISRESNNALVWSNLGILYLYIGDIYKANEAFCRAQRADPTNMNSWVGQAIIAEKIKYREAVDLFRHSAQLGYHNEACLGYSHGVLTLLLDVDTNKSDPLYTYTIENMHAVSVATDLLTWYIEHNPNNAYALNTYGLLLERQKLYLSAAEQFTKALHECNEKEKDFICINLSRIFIRLNKYEEAIQLCKSVNNSTFNSQCHLALCLFKAKRYEESYTTYEAALHWFAKEESDKANTLCAMAAMAHIFQGVDDVKTLLFQCILIKPPMIAGFLAAASLGILHGDLNLTALVLNELESYKNDVEYRHHITALSAYSSLVQNNVANAINVLSKITFRYPNDVNCWINLARVLFEIDLTTFHKCAEKALYLSGRSSSNNIVYVVCASALSALTTENVTNALRNVQKAVFQFPNEVESWASFIAVLITRYIKYIDTETNPGVKWVIGLITIVQQQFSTKQQISYWLEKSKKKLLNISK